MKQLAEEEPDFAKVLHETARIGNKYFEDATDGLLWILTLGKRPNQQDVLDRERSLRMFEDAAEQLKALKEQAESDGSSSSP